MCREVFNAYVDSFMELVDSTWNDDDHRDKRRVRWRERFSCFNVSYGKMWGNKLDGDEEKKRVLEEKKMYMTKVLETALVWKEVEMGNIREIIANRWSEYYGVGIHEVNGSEHGHEEVYESCMESTDESLKTDDNVSTAYIDSGAEDIYGSRSRDGYT